MVDENKHVYHSINFTRMFRLIRSVGFRKRSYPVKHEVLSCETEVLSGETLFHRIGAPEVALLSGETMLHRIGPRVFHRKQGFLSS